MGYEVSGRPAAVVGRARVVRGALVRPAAGLVHVLLVLERVRAPRLQRGGGLRGPRPRTPREEEAGGVGGGDVCSVGSGVWHGRRWRVAWAAAAWRGVCGFEFGWAGVGVTLSSGGNGTRRRFIVHVALSSGQSGTRHCFIVYGTQLGAKWNHHCLIVCRWSRFF